MLEQIVRQQTKLISEMATRIDLLQAALGILKIRCDANEGVITHDEALKQIEVLTKNAENKAEKPKSRIIV